MRTRSKSPLRNSTPFLDINRLEKEARVARRNKERLAMEDNVEGNRNGENRQEERANGIGNQQVPPVHAPREERRIGDFDEPIANGTRTGIHPPPCANNNWEIKSSLINMVQNNRFFGLPNEHPIEHLDNFERLCGTVRVNGVSEDVFKLTLFPFSLGDKASQWEKSVVTSSITTWDECKKRFLAKFFSNQRTARIRNDISTFKQGPHETLYEAWERLKGYMRSCPHHGVPKEAILGIFHRGIEEKFHIALDTASQGDFGSLTIAEGEKLIENLAQSTQHFNKEFDRSTRETKWDAPRGEDHRIKEMSDKLDKLILATKKQVHFVEDLDGSEGMLEELKQGDCEEVSYVQGQGYYNKGFNPNYRTHPNLSYRSTNVENPQDQVYPPKTQGFVPQNRGQGFVPRQQGYTPRQNFYPSQAPNNYQGQASSSNQSPQDQEIKSLVQRVLDGQIKNSAEIGKKFLEVNARIDGMYQELDGKITSLASHVKTIDNQVAQFASKQKAPMGTLPGKPESNPKSFCGAVYVEGSEEDELYLEELAKLLEGPFDDDLVVKEDELKVETFTPTIKPKRVEPPMQDPTKIGSPIPFPKMVYTKAIKRILWKYMKDMEEVGGVFPKDEGCEKLVQRRKMIKDVLENHGRVMEVMKNYQAKEEVDKPRTLSKKEFPGKFSLPCSLGDLKIDDALCDSGSGVNVISLEIYNLLGAKELKKNETSLVFADSSSKRPLGILEDYPLKIGNCVVPTDFMVIEMDNQRSMPIILGTPFLATTEACMDFKNMRAILYKVDPYTYYDITPSQSSLCGTLSSGDNIEMMSIETSKEEITVEKKPPRIVEDGLEAFYGNGLSWLFEEKEERIELNPESVSLGMYTARRSMVNPAPNLTLHPIGKVDGGLMCKTSCKGAVQPFSRVKIIIPPDMSHDQAILTRKKMKQVFKIDLEEWEPSTTDGSTSTDH